VKHSSLRRIVTLVLVSLTFLAALAAAASAQPPRKIAELELSLFGVSASVEPAEPTVPKNIASAVRVVVRAGTAELSVADVARFVGSGFEIQGELSGPGLRETVTLPQRSPGDPPPEDPLLLPLPALSVAGDYTLDNVRVVAGGRTALDASPSHVTVKVLDQILVTSVRTRPLTLDEIREKGIVLDSDDYLGFEFTLGLKLESKAVNLTFPVAFDRQGLAVPQPILPPPPAAREAATLPTIVPLMLDAEATPGAGTGSRQRVRLTLPNGEPIRIPSVLVIPGNVGYLKQFFSAQLLVANGAPVGSGLVVRDVSGRVKLPPGGDHELGTDDDPLALPETVRGTQPDTLPVRGVGPDGEPDTGDDIDAFAPAQQGQAEFLIRGEREGFHTIEFDIAATLDGLPVGPVKISGKASGGVLVRNPFFDVSFAAPSVVRSSERFKFFVTVTNIGQGLGNDVNVTLDASRISGAHLVGDGTQRIATLGSGDAKTLEFMFESERTGQVVASYLHFDSRGGATGDLRFTLGVGERGVPLSPDTIVLPASTDDLPAGFVAAAMRVLGQAWSIANAPAGTLPRGVARTSKTAATQKALALAEAGLRVRLGQPRSDAIRDLLLDWYGGDPLDAGFDQLLRQTWAGRDFVLAAGAAVSESASVGGAIAYEEALARVAASGPDFLSFTVGGGSSVADVVLTDGLGRATHGAAAANALPESAVPGVVIAPLGSAPSAPLLGLLTAPLTPPYTIEIVGRGSGSTDLSASFPRGDGSFLRVVATGVLVGVGSRTRLTLDLARPDALVLKEDANGDGTFESDRLLAATLLTPEGPTLVSATVIGPETIAGATPFGLQAAVLFDRVVDAGTASRRESYALASNAVRAARRQLSGRFVFISLAQPEGPYVDTTITVNGIADARGVTGTPVTLPLVSRIEDPGAVVSGRILNADGSPVGGAVVVYRNNPNWDTCDPDFDPARSGVALTTVGPDGRYEFRYVRQDTCGERWEIVTQDPATGARRTVSGFVRTPGEQFLLDIVMFGRGSVAGVVRDLSGALIPAARVVAVSGTDPQVGGTTSTDGAGRYRIDGVTVGPVSVTAGKGIALGRAAGRIDRAGGVATVDVTLDGGSVRASGTVHKLEHGRLSVIPNLQVVFRVPGPARDEPVGVTTTDGTGHYVFTGMPTGAFTIDAALNTRDRASHSGISSAGQDVQADLLIVVPEPDAVATLRGVVRSHDGTPASGIIVSVEQRGVLSSAEGAFEIPGIAVRPNQLQTVRALSRDGLRSATAQFIANRAGETVEGVALTLSALGAVEFQVLDAGGHPVAGQDVLVVSSPRAPTCGDPCGCDARKTNGEGRVRYEELPFGQVMVQAVREGAGFADVARAVASVRTGEPGFAIVRFAGAGTVTGTVLAPDGRPVFGADVSLTSEAFFNDGTFTCGLTTMVSHRARTDLTGRFRFAGVNVGAVGVTATQSFFPTAVGSRGFVSAAGQTVDFTLRLENTTAGELSGVVYLPDGVTPAGGGIEVRANGMLPDVIVRTNGESRYRFARIFPEGIYTLTVRDPVTGGLAQERIFLRAAQDLTHDFRLKGKGSVRARVVDGADQPVHDAAVRLTETEFPRRVQEGAAEAANQGVVAFENVFEGPVSVEASDAFGRGGRASAVVPRSGSVVEVKVRLTTTGRVTGRFVMRDRTTPIPFGVVKLIAGGRAIGQTTSLGSGEVGSFSFDHVPAGPVRVEAQDPVTARTGVAVGSIVAQDELVYMDVIAQGLGSVQGLITSNGDPQPGAHVEVVSGPLRAITFADGSGRYFVDGIAEGAVVVTASLDRGFLSGTASAELAGDGTPLTIDVALRGAGAVDGRVVRADGVTAGPPALVTLWSGGVGGGSQTTTTDLDGRFRFSRVPAGPTRLSADVLDSIDRGATTADVPVGGTIQPLLRLVGLGRVLVSVVDAHGAPVGGANVTVVSSASDEGFSGVTSFDGIARIPEVYAGTARATAFDPLRGLRGESAPATVSDGGETPLTVQLEPAGRVSGHVLRPDGTGAAGVTVTLRGARMTTSAADGGFAFENVSLGRFDLVAEDASDHDRGAATGAVLLEGESVTKDVRLNGVGEVRVEVRDRPGAPAGEVEIEIFSASPFGGFYRAMTGLDGRVTVPHVLAGGVTVDAYDRARLIGGRGSGTLAAAGRVDIAISLDAVVVVHGRVLAPNGRDGVAGALVSARGRSALSGTGGAFEVLNVPQGDVSNERITATVGGRVRAVDSIDLRNPTVEKDLVLVPAGTVRGVVRTAEDALAAGQAVTVECIAGLPHPDLSGHFFTTTNDLGAYAVADVPACHLRVSVSNDSNDSAEATGTIATDGQLATVNLKYQPNSIRLPWSLSDGNGQAWNIAADGVADPGPSGLFHTDLFDRLVRGGPRLRLMRNGISTDFVGSGGSAASEEDHREVVVRQADVAGLTVTRKVFVPPLGYFARYLEVLENAGPDPVTVDVAEEVNLAQFGDGLVNVVDTSSGDSQADGTDRWFVLDDENDLDFYASSVYHAPPLAVVAGGEGHSMAPGLRWERVTASSSRMTYGWTGVVVPAAGRVALLHVLSAQADRARARASAARLASSPPELLQGLRPGEAAQVANFALPLDLQAAVEALAPNDGQVTGRILAGDGTTAIGADEVVLRSRSPHYGAPVAGEVLPDGSFLIRAQDGRGLPRTAFDVVAKRGGRTAAAAGEFRSAGRVDLTTLLGRTLRASSAFRELGVAAELSDAVDGDTRTQYRWAEGDAAGPPFFRQPWYEVGFPSQVTVEAIHLRGSRVTHTDLSVHRARFEVRDGQGAIVWSREVELSAPARDIDLVVPAVDGARTVRLVDVGDASDSPAIAEVQVLGQASAGPTGRAVADVVFDGAGLVEGRLLRTNGTGIRAFVMLTGESRDQSVASSTDGSFRFDVVAPGTYTLTGNVSGSSVTVSTTVSVVAGLKTHQDLVAPPLGLLRGSPRRADGQAADTRITVTGDQISRVTTTVGNQWQVADLPVGSYVVSAFNLSSRVTLTRTVTVDADSATEVEFVFPPYGTVEVQATLDGVPLEGAAVQWQSDAIGPSWTDAGPTDALGRLAIGGVTGPTVRVRAFYPGSLVLYREATASLTVQDEVVVAAIDLPAADSLAGALTGLIRRADGTPAVAVPVDVIADGHLAATLVTDESGHYTYGLAPVGPLAIRAYDVTRAGSPIEVRGRLPHAGAGITLDATLPGRLSFAGERHLYRVTAPTVAGESLTLAVDLYGRAIGAAPALPDPYLEVYDAAGALVAANDDAAESKDSSVNLRTLGGTYTIVARGAGSASGGYDVDAYVFGSTEDGFVNRFLPLALDEGAVSGTVTRRDTGAPAPGQRVRLVASELGLTRNALTDVDGAFSIVAVPAGDWTLAAVDPGGDPIATATGSMLPGGALPDVDLTVSIHAPVTVRVTRGNVNEAAVPVTFESSDAAAPAEDRVRTRVTDAGGAASTYLPIGTVIARATDPINGTTVEATGSLTEGGSLSLPIVFGDPLATIRGTVTAPDGHALAGAEVTLEAVGTQRTDGSGAYRFGGLAAGGYSLMVRYQGTTALQGDLRVSGNELVVDVTLLVHILKGRVQDAAGIAVEATLSACSFDESFSQRCVGATSARDGTYAIYGLPNWNVTLFSSPPWSVTVPVTAILTDGSFLSDTRSFTYNRFDRTPIVLDFTMPPSGSVSGAVRDATGLPVANASVRLSGRSRRTLTADGTGRFSFPHVLTGPIRLTATDADGIPGEAAGEVVGGREVTIDISLAPTATLSGTLVDEADAALERWLSVDILDVPGGPWNHAVHTAPEGGSFSVRVPAGLFRLVFEGDFDNAICDVTGAAAAEGTLAPNEQRSVSLRRGSHAHLPVLLSGPLGSYGRAPSCLQTPEPAAFIEPTVREVEAYPLVVARELDGQGFATLLAAGNDLRVRKKTFVPASGAFSRTLTLVTNTAASAVTVHLDSTLSLRGHDWTILTTSSGDAGFDAADSYAIVRNPEGGENDTAFVSGGALLPSSVAFVPGTAPVEIFGAPLFATTHVFTVPPGETRALLAFSISRPPADEVALRAQAAALEDLSDPDALAGLTEEERAALVNFDLPAARLEGVVRDRAGAPVAFARVGVVDRASNLLAETTADAEGRYRFDGLPPGEYRAIAIDPATSLPGASTFAIGGGERLSLDVTLRSSNEVGSVHVRGVLEETGRPAAGFAVLVQAEGFEGFWQADLVLDENGEGVAVGVPAGRVFVSTGTPPDGGWQMGRLPPLQELSVDLRIGSRYPFPIDLTGSDGAPYFARADSAVEASGIGEDWNCDPFCTGYAEFSDATGPRYYYARPLAFVTDGGRAVWQGPDDDGALRITRWTFVPPAGRFVRVLDVIENTSADELPLNYYVEQAHRSASGPWTIDTTSSGDADLDTGDGYITMSSGDPRSPAMAWVIAGAGPRATRHETLTSTSGEWTWFWDDGQLTVPAHGKAILMRFAVQRPAGDLQAARDQALALMTLTDPEALTGMTPADRAAIVNFAVNP
jgi:hypothetical protein